MKKSAREKLIEAQKQKFNSASMDFDGLLALLVDGDRPPEERRLNPTQKAFIYNTSFYGAYMGPAGCAKTSTLCAKLFARALLEPGTKHLVARQDYNDLMDTTALRMEEMLSRLPPGTLLDRSKNPPMKWWIKPAVGGPGMDETPSQITFMGLKGDLGSTEYNSVIIDEASEVTEKAVQELGGRMRYGKVKFPDYQYTIDMAFNPPDMSHWLYRACTGKDEKDLQQSPAWVKLFRPQPTENVRNLPDGYYDRMVSSMPEDMRQRLVDGVWGTTFPGDPVLRQFRRSMHVSSGATLNPAGTLFRFWDFGYRRPACLWAQITLNGGLRILREFMGKDMEAEPFIRSVFAQTAEHFPQAERFQDWGDPAVAQKKDTGQMLAVLYQAGIKMKFKRTPLDMSLNLLRKQMERTVDGSPALQIHPSCLILISALSGGYHFKIKEGAMEPFKDGYYDHLCLVAGSKISTPDGVADLENIGIGSNVMSVSPRGEAVVGTVTEAHYTGTRPVYSLTAFGKTLIGTGNHPVLTQRGWVTIDALRYGDYVVSHESKNRSRDLSGVQREEVLAVREILLDPDGVQQAGVPAQGGGRISPRKDRQTECASQERGSDGQQNRKPGASVPLGAHEDSHGGPCEASGGEGKHCSYSCAGGPCVAQESGREGVAQRAQQGGVEEYEAVVSALRHLRKDVQKQVEEGEVLRPELQGQELQATKSWVRQALPPQPVFNVTVEPYNNFVADGFVVHNCDALRYGVWGTLGQDTSEQHGIPQTIEYRREDDK